MTEITKSTEAKKMKCRLKREAGICKESRCGSKDHA